MESSTIMSSNFENEKQDFHFRFCSCYNPTFYRWFISGGSFFNHLFFYHLKTDTWPYFIRDGWFWNFLKFENWGICPTSEKLLAVSWIDYFLNTPAVREHLQATSVDTRNVINRHQQVQALERRPSAFPILRFIDGVYRNSTREADEEGLQIAFMKQMHPRW